MWLLAVLALSLEVGALWLLVLGINEAPDLAAFLLLRVVAAACASLFISATLPTRLRPQSRAIASLLFALGLLLPGLGMIGLAIAFGWALRKVPPPARRVERRVVHIPDVAWAERQPPWRQSLSAVLRGSPSSAERERAVGRVKRLSGAPATRLLHLAMKDPVDDVRLFAYAVQEARVNDIDARVKSAQQALEAAGRNERAFWLERIAREQWELVYADHVEGELRAHTLRSVRAHLQETLSLVPRGDLFVLYARVLLALNEVAAARKALDSAERAGVSRQALSTWLAEVAFKTRCFSEIGELLALAPQRAVLSGPRAFWS